MAAAEAKLRLCASSSDGGRKYVSLQGSQCDGGLSPVLQHGNFHPPPSSVLFVDASRARRLFCPAILLFFQLHEVSQGSRAMSTYRPEMRLKPRETFIACHIVQEELAATFEFITGYDRSATYIEITIFSEYRYASLDSARPFVCATSGYLPHIGSRRSKRSLTPGPMLECGENLARDPRLGKWQ